MRFTKNILEQLENVQSIGKFFLYVFLFGLAISIGVITLIWWGLKSRFL